MRVEHCCLLFGFAFEFCRGTDPPLASDDVCALSLLCKLGTGPEKAMKESTQRRENYLCCIFISWMLLVGRCTATVPAVSEGNYYIQGYSSNVLICPDQSIICEGNAANVFFIVVWAIWCSFSWAGFIWKKTSSSPKEAMGSVWIRVGTDILNTIDLFTTKILKWIFTFLKSEIFTGKKPAFAHPLVSIH